MPREKKSCTIEGISYESQHAASKALGIPATLLKARIASSNFPNYTSKHHRKVKKKAGGRISCIIKGVKYISAAAASKKLKVSASTIMVRLKSLKHLDYVSPDVPKNPPKPPKYRVNGENYYSLQEVADMEGVTKEWIRQKMNNPGKPEYQRI